MYVCVLDQTTRNWRFWNNSIFLALNFTCQNGYLRIRFSHNTCQIGANLVKLDRFFPTSTCKNTRNPKKKKSGFHCHECYNDMDLAVGCFSGKPAIFGLSSKTTIHFLSSNSLSLFFNLCSILLYVLPTF